MTRRGRRRRRMGIIRRRSRRTTRGITRRTQSKLGRRHIRRSRRRGFGPRTLNRLKRRGLFSVRNGREGRGKRGTASESRGRVVRGVGESRGVSALF